MQIKITQAFWDLQNPAEEPVAVDTVMSPDDARAEQLVAYGLAEPTNAASLAADPTLPAA